MEFPFLRAPRPFAASPLRAAYRFVECIETARRGADRRSEFFAEVRRKRDHATRSLHIRMFSQLCVNQMQMEMQQNIILSVHNKQQKEAQFSMIAYMALKHPQRLRYKLPTGNCERREFGIDDGRREKERVGIIIASLSVSPLFSSFSFDS